MFDWVTVFFDWLQTDFTYGSFTFSFWDVIVWCMVASVLIWGFQEFFDN